MPDIVDKAFDAALKNNCFTGASFLVSSKGEIVREGYYGDTGGGVSSGSVKNDILFDLASLTKPLATTMFFLLLWQDGKIYPDDFVSDYLSSYFWEQSFVKIENLLLHDSGLPAHREYFKILDKFAPEDRESERLRLISLEDRGSMPGEKVCYSDLGFMVLKYILEKIAGMCMAEYLETKFYSMIGAEDALFPAFSDCAEKKFMTTSYSSFRKRYLFGEVDDENAFIIGGVDGHAGLFGNCLSIHKILNEIYISLFFDGSKVLRRDFLLKLINKKNMKRVCGFDTPDRPVSSAGSFFSKNTIGHLGFTGTSFWMDLEKELWIILLTNRVYFKDSKPKIQRFRPYIHDILFEECLFCSCK